MSKRYHREPERLIWPVFDVTFKVQVDYGTVRNLETNEHFALNACEYLAKSPENFYISDRGLAPPFLNIRVQCQVGKFVPYDFTFGPNDILHSANRDLVCFGQRAPWASRLNLTLLTEDDMDFKFYCRVFHDTEKGVVVFSELALVFPYEFRI